jgi:tRNA-guanine family transglycosylase
VRLATMHNLRFYINLMEKIRKSIEHDYFDELLKGYKEIKE